MPAKSVLLQYLGLFESFCAHCGKQTHGLVCQGLSIQDYLARAPFPEAKHPGFVAVANMAPCSSCAVLSLPHPLSQLHLQNVSPVLEQVD